MATNKVQFQKGLSIAEFMDRYGTQEKCHAALVAIAMADRFCLPELRWLAPVHVRAQGTAVLAVFGLPGADHGNLRNDPCG